MTKHDTTLRRIFTNPVSANIKWTDIEKLFIYYGAYVTEAAGSRICIDLNGIRAVFHRPHPRPDTDKGAVKSVRQFLKKAGIEPS